MLSPLLINIGNTSAQFVFPDGRRDTIPTAVFAKDAMSAFAGPCPDHWFAASVVPSVNPVLEALAKTRDAQLYWLSCEDLIGIDCSQVDMTTVGSDRLANIAAAAVTLDLPAIVVDFGTAITTEVVRPGPAFVGGAILPGRAMQRQALGQFTGLLPVVPLSATHPSAVGASTPEAIMAGIDMGTLGSVERLIQLTRNELGVSAVTVAGTGGDADFFIEHSSQIKRAPEPFTILGLRALAKTIQWPD